MEEKKMISVTKEDGTTAEVEVLLLFTLDEFQKDYMIYTEGETEGEGESALQTVYASIVKSVDNGYELEKIEDENEWSKVKDVMRQVIKDND